VFFNYLKFAAVDFQNKIVNIDEERVKLQVMYTVFHKKGAGTKISLFWQHGSKLNENHSKHARFIIHCDYEINVVGFLTVLFSVNLAHTQGL